MSIEKILNESTYLRKYSIKIDDFELIPDDIISLEVMHDFFSFGINGVLKIKDSFDILNNGEIKFANGNKVTIYFEDFLNDKTKRVYYISDIKITLHNERFKVLNISFIDEITHKLKTTYISKSFTDTPVIDFNSYIEHLGIDTLLSESNLDLNVTDTSTSESFVVPQDRNIIDFFNYQLKRHNVRIWQDRKSLNVSEVDLSSLSVQQIDGEDALYTNNTLNNAYIFKIHEYEEVNNQNYGANLEKPSELIYRYDSDKTISSDTLNIVDVYNDLKMNNLDVSTIQGDYKRTGTQSSNSTEKQKYELFDHYLSNNEIALAVPGSLKYNNVGYVINIELKGNPLYSDTGHENDVYSSGKYFVAAVSDKIIGDRFIQKMTCIRLDTLEPRKYK